MLCNIIEKLIVPTVTWWYTFCEAYAQIIEIPFADLNHTSQRKFKCTNDREYQFLKEYCSIMKPFTVKLDFLRDEDTCYYWHASTKLEVPMV